MDSILSKYLARTKSKQAAHWNVSLVDFAYERILEAIVDQELAPGSRINLNNLSEEFEISNTPIREALARLTASGLVQQFSNRGFVVSPILSEREYHQLFDVRCLLETNALRTATFSQQTLDELEEIARNIVQFDWGTTYRDFMDNLKTDESFHINLLRATNNRFYLDAWLSLNFHSHVSRLHTQEEAFDPQQLAKSLGEHVIIVELLRNNDRDAAVDVLDKHIRSVENRLVTPTRKLTQPQMEVEL